MPGQVPTVLEHTTSAAVSYLPRYVIRSKLIRGVTRQCNWCADVCSLVIRSPGLIRAKTHAATACRHHCTRCVVVDLQESATLIRMLL